MATTLRKVQELKLRHLEPADSFYWLAERTKLQISLYYFGCRAFQAATRSTPHVQSKHQEVLADVLAKCRSREITRFLLNVPPSCGKAMWTNVLLPAWIWTKQPSSHFSLYSNQWRLIKRDVQFLKNLLTSEWFTHYFPEVKLKGKGAMYALELDSGGSLRGATPGSEALSAYTLPEYSIFDDPQTREQAECVTRRRQLIDWFMALTETRNSGVHILSQARLHSHDLSGAIIERYTSELAETGITAWVHASLPMRYRPEFWSPITQPFADWRAVPGTSPLLFPEFMNEKRVARLEKSLSRQCKCAVETQLQQNVDTSFGSILDLFRLGDANTVDESVGKKKSQQCLNPNCDRPAFASVETDGYCCSCCAESKDSQASHRPRCNGQYADWKVSNVQVPK
jgi:hypothetical protein